MATLNQVIKGLEIFAKHGLGDEHDICAEHDIIYAGANANGQLTRDEYDQLEALGWHWDESVDSWACFV